VQVYIADLHGPQDIPSLDGPGGVCQNAWNNFLALGSGDPCYVAQAKFYNDAFGVFFKRLAADGITPANTLFVVSSDEGDHEAGANVGRAIQPTPASCDGVTTPCSYPAGSFGELAGNVTGLLKVQKNNTTPFGMEFDTAPEYYINGNPGPDASVTRTFEHDVAGLTAVNPYAGHRQLGVDGPGPADGPNSAGPNSGQTVVADSGTTGTWVDETDILPTMIYLTGLTDDYGHDGRVITQILADPNHALSRPGVAVLGACYKQLNSSVGQFANFTLQADTKAIESSTPGDARYLATDKALTALDHVRDVLALRIKADLEAAAFGDTPIQGAGGLTFACQAVIGAAALLDGQHA
jgi:hypothetical protein